MAVLESFVRLSRLQPKIIARCKLQSKHARDIPDSFADPCKRARGNPIVHTLLQHNKQSTTGFVGCKGQTKRPLPVPDVHKGQLSHTELTKKEKTSSTATLHRTGGQSAGKPLIPVKRAWKQDECLQNTPKTSCDPCIVAPKKSTQKKKDC